MSDATNASASYEGIVHAERYTICPFSSAQAYAEDFLRESGEAIVVAGPLRRRVAFRFRTRFDTAELGRAHEEIVLNWSAGTTFLPDFSGILRLRIALPGTLLVLDGHYVPPGRNFGAFFDRIVGKRIARVSCDSLLTRLEKVLAERQRASRSDMEASDTEALASAATP